MDNTPIPIELSTTVDAIAGSINAVSERCTALGEGPGRSYGLEGCFGLGRDARDDLCCEMRWKFSGLRCDGRSSVYIGRLLEGLLLAINVNSNRSGRSWIVVA